MIRLRQVVFAAADLATASRELESTLGVGSPFHDPGVGEFGLVNAVYPVGEQFVEVVSPDPLVTEPTAVDRFLDRNAGPGGYMLIVQTDRVIDEVRADLDGVRIVYEAVAPGIVGLHLHPVDVGGAIVSIDRADEWAEWPWAGPDWRERSGATPVADGIVGVDIAVPDPAGVAARWQGWFGGERDGTTLRLGCGTDVTFSAERTGTDRAAIVGVRFAATPGNATFDQVCLGVRCYAP